MNETVKIIFISKLVFFTENNELIEENLRIADLFDSEDVILGIIARKATIDILRRKIPKDYNDKIKLINRSKHTKDKIKVLKEKGAILGLIGIVQEDAIFSFNCKIPLFNPEKMSDRVVISDKVKKYGLPISDFQNVIDCLKAFEIHKENYFQMKFENNFSVISLNNANRYYRPEIEVRIKQIFETNLKGDESVRNQRILLLLLFHLINEVTTNPFYEKVDYWGTFPSSDPQNTVTSISFLKEAVRVLIDGKPRNGPELLIRHSSMNSKHSSDASSRLTNKSNKDFDTLIVNPALINQIKGKVVCIIDDYITNGYSAEAAKHLLFAAGVKEVIFLSFGKFGKKYYYTDYKIKGNVSTKYSYELVSEIAYKDTFNGEEYYNLDNDIEILDFNDLV